MGRVGDARQRNVFGHDGRRQRLGDPVGDGEAGLAVVDAGRILQRRFGFNGAEGDDLGDPVVAPLVGGVAHHLAATTVVEVDIDVGCRRTFRVEEPLEQQAVRDGVDVGDAHRVGHQRTRRRTTARPHPDVDRPRVVDQVGDDQEVRRKALVADDLDLELGPVDVVLAGTGSRSDAAAPPSPRGAARSPGRVLRAPGTPASGRAAPTRRRRTAPARRSAAWSRRRREPRRPRCGACRRPTSGSSRRRRT